MFLAKLWKRSKRSFFCGCGSAKNLPLPLPHKLLDIFFLTYRRKHFHHSTSALFNRGSTKSVVVFHEFKGFREQVLCLLIVFISYFSVLISYM